MAETNNQGNWRKLIKEMWRRIIHPFGQPVFIFYFLLIVIFFGGLGVLIPVGKLFFVENNYQNLMAIPTALITYAFAISASAFLDLSMSKTPENYRSFWLLGFGVWVLSMAISIVGYFPADFNIALLLTVIGTVLSLILWWIANCDNTNLQESNYNTETTVTSELAGQGVSDGTASFE